VADRVRIDTEGALAWIVFDQPAFASGADVSEFERARRTAGGVDAYDTATVAALTALARIDKPLVAAIHGACVGGGLGIALTADLRYAAQDARFGIPSARLGVAYPLEALGALVDTVGSSHAKEILFSARLYDAQEALAMRLVNAVVEKSQLDTFVRRQVEGIAANAPLSLRGAKLGVDLLARPWAVTDREDALASVRVCAESEDYAEGVRAFRERRSPRFRGR